MTARQLLFNDNGALRALWRLLIFAAATIASFVVAESIVGPIIAAAAMALSSLSVITNSATLKRLRLERTP